MEWMDQDEKKSSGGKKKKEKHNWPSKRTMNLYIKRKTLSHPTRWVPILVAIFAVAFLIGKYGVADRLARLDAARAELQRQKDYVRMLQDKTSDYAEVKQEYNRYSYTGFDRTLQDRLDVLTLIEEELFPACTVERMSVTGRQLTLTISNLSLKDNAELVERLERHEDMVEAVYISSTSYDDKDKKDENQTGTDGDDRQLVQISILLRNAEEKGGES